MQFSIYLNQPRAQEWGLNLAQAVFFSYLYEAQSWCDSEIINDQVYYWISKEKVIQELPILSDKPDTIKRYLNTLETAGLILRKVISNRIFVAITEKGKLWNRTDKTPKVTQKEIKPSREKNPPLNSQAGKNIPTKGGNKSPLGREKFPPYQYTNDQPTNNQIDKSKPKGSAKPSVLEKLSAQYPTIKHESIQFALDHRKAKKAAMTDRGSKLFFDEVLNCSYELNISPEQVIDIVINRDWKGVNTEWVRKHLNDNAPPAQQQLATTQAPQRSANGRQAVSDAINDIQNTDW